MKKIFSELIKYLEDKRNFIDVALDIFSTVTKEIADEISLFQLDSDGKMCRRILYSDSRGGVDYEEGHPVYLDSVLEENPNTVVMPIFIRNEVAMYLKALCKTGDSDIRSEILKVALLIQNIAEDRNFKSSISGSYQVLEDALDSIPIGVAILDNNKKEVLLMNRVATESEAVQNAIGIGLDRYLESGESSLEDIYEDTSGLWYDVQFTDLDWINKEKVLVGTAIDVTQKVKNRQRIEYQANNDYLTGLFNRMKCERDLSEIIKKTIAAREKGVLIFLDLDNFKQVNDGLGHQYGDVLLQEVAGALQSVPQINNCCYRMGGDEFVIIVHPDKFKYITDIVETISKRFNQAWHIMDVDYYCTMSMGLAIFPDHGQNVEEIIKNADFVMYEAKKGGKNKYLWYSLDYSNSNAKKTEFENSIRDLVVDSCKDFEIHYQPVVDTEGKIYGAEALVRINSGEMGTLMPIEFLPVAEYLGLMNKIGNFVFLESCKTLKEWNVKHPDLKLYINMAPTQLMVSKAAEQIINMVNEAGADINNVCCEISEKTEFRSVDTALDTMEILNVHGMTVSLDDFGSGKMSIDFLKRSHASIIKFDSSFTRILPPTNYSKMILKAISEIAKNLKIDIAFVGIETEEQKNLAIEAGGRFLEGFYFGEALPKDKFEAVWL